jgi:hypothetical protein
MKERGILFSGPMVRALLSNQKTMTRRAIKDFPVSGYRWGGWIVESSSRKETGAATVVPESNSQYCATGKIAKLCPYGERGDRLYVRETWTYDNKEYVQTYKDEAWRGTPDHETAEVYYRSSERDPDIFPSWRPSIHMPRWASRTTLEITKIRVERLNGISEEDAIQEGIREENVIIGATCAGGSHRELYGIRYFFDGGNEDGYEDAISAFKALWESINGSGSWNVNPWVWVVEFTRVMT